MSAFDLIVSAAGTGAVLFIAIKGNKPGLILEMTRNPALLKDAAKSLENKDVVYFFTRTGNRVLNRNGSHSGSIPQPSAPPSGNPTVPPPALASSHSPQSQPA